MLAPHNLFDIALPDRTLCLTFDDGPGPHSAAIGRLLAANGIRATFFVVGKFALERPEVLDELHAQGHLIGNHTFEHPDMPFFVSAGGDARDQIIRTNQLIQKYNHNKPTYLRATYGKWSPEVTRALRVDLRSDYMHVGPVHWDIDGIDCWYWQQGKSVPEAAQAYWEAIHAKGRGIVVMHDHAADMDTVARRTRTLALCEQLVPRLLASGYRFIGLDEIDDPQLTDPRHDTFALKGPGGVFLRHSDEAGAPLHWDGRSAREPTAQFRLERAAEGKVMLCTPGGHYLSVDAERDPTVRLASRSEHALMDMIPLAEGDFMLRCGNGHHLAGANEAGGRLLANAPYLRQAWRFTYAPPGSATLRRPSAGQRWAHARRRLLFIKSKLMHG